MTIASRYRNEHRVRAVHALRKDYRLERISKRTTDEEMVFRHVGFEQVLFPLDAQRGRSGHDRENAGNHRERELSSELHRRAEGPVEKSTLPTHAHVHIDCARSGTRYAVARGPLDGAVLIPVIRI